MVEQGMGKQPFSGDLFLFYGRDKRIVKALCWDRNGFCLWTKWVEKGSFPWLGETVADDQSVSLSREELTMLLDGIDFRKRFTSLQCSRIS